MFRGISFHDNSGMEITADSARGQELKRVIAGGEVEALRAMLDAEPALARARVAGPGRERRTLLHVATDWPGHFPRVAETITLLMERGADADAPMEGGNAPERPLHGAASSNDVAAIDGLGD